MSLSEIKVGQKVRMLITIEDQGDPEDDVYPIEIACYDDIVTVKEIKLDGELVVYQNNKVQDTFNIYYGEYDLVLKEDDKIDLNII